MMRPTEPPWEGACRCGRVRLRVTTPPMLSIACHCIGCQKLTSSAFSLGIAVPAEALEIEGETELGGLHGPNRHEFCAWCKSWIVTRPARFDWFVAVRSSLLDQDFPPFVDIYTSAKRPWVQTGAKRSFPEFPSGEEYAALMRAYAAAGRPSARGA